MKGAKRSTLAARGIIMVEQTSFFGKPESIVEYSFDEFLTEGMASGAWAKVEPPRPLSLAEKSVIDRLLSIDFPGADQLRKQVPSVRVIATAQGGDGSIKMSPARGPELAAAVVGRVPVEAKATDPRGAEVEVLLHVVEGFLAELEVMAWDGNPHGLPAASELEVF